MNASPVQACRRKISCKKAVRRTGRLSETAEGVSW
jgi:hypothetical protein